MRQYAYTLRQPTPYSLGFIILVTCQYALYTRTRTTRYMCALWVPLRALPWPHVQRGTRRLGCPHPSPDSGKPACGNLTCCHPPPKGVAVRKRARAHARALPRRAAGAQGARGRRAPAATPHLGNVTPRSLHTALAAATRAPTSCQCVRPAPLAPQAARVRVWRCVAACPHQRRLLCRRGACAAARARARGVDASPQVSPRPCGEAAIWSCATASTRANVSAARGLRARRRRARLCTHVHAAVLHRRTALAT